MPCVVSMGEFVIQSAEKTDDEKYREHLKKHQPELLTQNIQAIPDDEARSLTIAREEFVRADFQKKLNAGRFQADEAAEFIRDQEDDSSFFNVEEFHEL
jgi:hypothetical protein